MTEAGFEPADYSTKWQRPTIRPLPGSKVLKQLFKRGEIEPSMNIMVSNLQSKFYYLPEDASMYFISAYD